MATMIYDCPHCGGQRMGFTYEAAFPSNGFGGYGLVFNCNGCEKPVTAVFTPEEGWAPPSQYAGNLLDDRSPFTLIAIFPESSADDTPSNIPEPVQRAFRQAAGSLRAGHYDAACSMYRKAMELGLKAFSPDIEAWKIEKRIDKLASENRITAELKAWAHELRLDGNDAVHGDEEATAEVANQMHQLCRFLLIYLYTLPAQVAVAQARRAGE